MAARSFVGLQNQGATCYLNSLIQTLFLTPEFRRELFSLTRSEVGLCAESDDVHSVPNGNGNGNANESSLCENKKPRRRKRIIVELQKLFALLQLGECRSECSAIGLGLGVEPLLLSQGLSTRSLTVSFGWSAVGAEAQDQHDINELYNLLLDGIEGQMPRHKRILDKFYVGTTRSVIECSECRTRRTRTEQFSQINVVLHGHDDLISSLSAMYLDSPEELSGDNAYFCGHCGLKQRAQKYCRIETVPDVVVCNLNRFHYDLSTGERVKIQKKFKFPKALDLTPFIDHEDARTLRMAICPHSHSHSHSLSLCAHALSARMCANAPWPDGQRLTLSEERQSTI